MLTPSLKRPTEVAIASLGVLSGALLPGCASRQVHNEAPVQRVVHEHRDASNAPVFPTTEMLRSALSTHQAAADRLDQLGVLYHEVSGRVSREEVTAVRLFELLSVAAAENVRSRTDIFRRAIASGSTFGESFQERTTTASALERSARIEAFIIANRVFGAASAQEELDALAGKARRELTAAPTPSQGKTSPQAIAAQLTDALLWTSLWAAFLERDGAQFFGMNEAAVLTQSANSYAELVTYSLEEHAAFGRNEPSYERWRSGILCGHYARALLAVGTHNVHPAWGALRESGRGNELPVGPLDGKAFEVFRRYFASSMPEWSEMSARIERMPDEESQARARELLLGQQAVRYWEFIADAGRARWLATQVAQASGVDGEVANMELQSVYTAIVSPQSATAAPAKGAAPEARNATPQVIVR